MESASFPEGLTIEDSSYYFDGVELKTLAQEYGTPLYVMSETIIRRRCEELRRCFLMRYPGTRAYYASKAFQTPDMLRIVTDEGLGVDVVSGGELYVALKAGVSPSDIIFHGNAKTDQELAFAVEAGVGRIAVDNLEEVYRIEREAAKAGKTQAILFRVTPGVDSHTHRFISTGSLDSKFGIPLEPTETDHYIEALAACPHLDFAGLHFHVGSQLLENTSHMAALRIVLSFAARLARDFGLVVRELNMGGGYGIRYLPEEGAPSLSEFIDPLMTTIQEWSTREKFPMPACAIEPGRWIAGEAGLTLYQIIAVKKIPGVRTYVAVDGGMGDNIRPALYDAKYHAAIVGRTRGQGASAGRVEAAASERPPRPVTIAGRYCESGDILVRDVSLPAPCPGDILSLFSTGAYCFAMASNYNRVPRPALVMVKNGKARLSVRRETYEDLCLRDMCCSFGK
jgi:diaminopimelate decarboxylase